MMREQVINQLKQLGYTVVVNDDISVKACLRDAVLDVDAKSVSFWSRNHRKMNSKERQVSRQLKALFA